MGVQLTIKESVQVGIRMLDNVIDLNFYPTIEAKNSNFKHRPIGMGIMGLQDALFKCNLSFESPKALNFSDQLMEFISYNAGSSFLNSKSGEFINLNRLFQTTLRLIMSSIY